MYVLLTFLSAYTLTNCLSLCMALHVLHKKKKKISIVDFKFVLIVSHMSCFQLSDEFLFAQLHLSSSISPPLRLSLTFPSASTSLWRKAQLVELIIYSCLSPNSAPYRREKERKTRAEAVFLSCSCGRQKRLDDSFNLQGFQLPKHTQMIRTCTWAHCSFTEPLLFSLLCNKEI